MITLQRFDEAAEGEMKRRNAPECWRHAKLEAMGSLLTLWIRVMSFGPVLTHVDPIVEDDCAAECPILGRRKLTPLVVTEADERRPRQVLP